MHVYIPIHTYIHLWLTLLYKLAYKWMYWLSSHSITELPSVHKHTGTYSVATKTLDTWSQVTYRLGSTYYLRYGRPGTTIPSTNQMPRTIDRLSANQLSKPKCFVKPSPLLTRKTMYLACINSKSEAHTAYYLDGNSRLIKMHVRKVHTCTWSIIVMSLKIILRCYCRAN